MQTTASDKLKTEGCSKRGLIGDQRMALVFCRPAADDGPNKVLDNESAPNVEDIQCNVRASRQLLGKCSATIA